MPEQLGLGSTGFVLLGIAFILWVASTTPAGRRLRARWGADRAGRAPLDDVEYLLRACDGDRDRVARLLAHELDRQPELSEAQAYRRAIRRHLRDRT